MLRSGRLTLLSVATAALLGGCNTVARVSSKELKAYEVSLATPDGQLAVAWHGGTAGHDALYLQRLDTRGHPVGPAARLTDGSRDAFEPDLVAIESDLLVAWYEKDDAGALTAHVARLKVNGELLWRRQISSSTSSGRNPVVRSAGGRIWVAWIEGPAAGVPQVRAAELAATSGEVLAARALGAASTHTWNLNAAIDEQQRLYVVFDAQLGTRAKELQLLRYDGGEVQHVVLSADDGFDSVYPDISLSRDRFALTWFDARDGNTEIYLLSGTVGDLANVAQHRGMRITTTPGASFGAYVAWSVDRIGLAWCDSTSGQEEVYFQDFDARSRARGAARRMTDNTTQSLLPSITSWRGGFALAWTERTPDRAADGRGLGRTQSSIAVARFVR